jgi:hypothetical protein
LEIEETFEETGEFEMSGRSEHRIHISEQGVKFALECVKIKLDTRLKEKGRGTFASKHELLGIIEEEFLEVKNAVHEKGPHSTLCLRKELLDIAVGCVFGVACIDEGTMDW